MTFNHILSTPCPAQALLTVAAHSVEWVNLRAEQHEEDSFMSLYNQLLELKNYESFIFLLLYSPSSPPRPWFLGQLLAEGGSPDFKPLFPCKLPWQLVKDLQTQV